ncbi:hypothetical protein ACFY20_35080 [Streptomyces sp. NPDC001312]|uniref:hypothetical protein n=1 Tax=Streptomyces sp. NPDC001312 TaxID=3364561 RepID=UPI00368F63C9
MTETVVEQESVEKPAVTPVPAASDEQLVAMLVDRALVEAGGNQRTDSTYSCSTSCARRRRRRTRPDDARRRT